MLEHSEKISRHGWTLNSMTRLPEASKGGWKKTSGNQSLIGSIIYTGVEELGAEYLLSDNGIMWQQCMPYLNMTPQDVYDKAIATGTPKSRIKKRYYKPRKVDIQKDGNIIKSFMRS